MNKLNLGTYNTVPVLTDRNSNGNNHILITGASGYGKSNCIFHIIQELKKLNKSIVILDFSKSISVLKGFQIANILTSEYLATPFHKTSASLEQIICESDMLTDIWNFRNKQRNSIFSAMEKLSTTLVTDKENSFYPYINWISDDSPSADFSLLGYILEDSKNTDLATYFRDIALLSHQYKEEISISPWQLYRYPTGTQSCNRFLTELFLWGVWNKYTNAEPGTLPEINIVIDECQNLSWKKNSILNKILNEGRKYGINLLLSTQYITPESGNRQIISAFQQAGLRLIFHPPANEITATSKLITSSDSSFITRELQHLQIGECFACGSLIISNSPCRQQSIKIKVPKGAYTYV